MKRIELISMPFAAIDRASFGLTQIQGILKKRFHEKFEVNIRYMNHDFAYYIGFEKYCFGLDGTTGQTGLEMDSTTTGLKEWLFKHIVFPECDNRQKDLFEYLSYVSKEVKEYAYSLKDEIDDWLNSMVKKFSLDKADVVAFTCLFDQRMPSFALARKIKESNPDAVIIMGGPACEYPAARVIAKNISCVDYIISGLGLSAFTELIDRLFINKTKKPFDIPGVFSDQNVFLLEESSQCYGKELSINEELQLDYKTFFDSLRRFKNEPIMPMLFFETSRGCWWAEKRRCLFCDINGRNIKYDVKNTELALKELKNLFEYKNECDIFWATDSVIPETLLDEVFLPLDNVTNGLKIFYEARTDISYMGLKKMAKHNIHYVQAGAESLDDKILHKLNKGVTTETNLLFFKRCVELGIHVLWNILTGIPGEDEKSYSVYLDLIPHIFHLPPPSGIWSVSYQRNSEYYEHQNEYGFELKPRIEPEVFLYPFSEDEISDLVYTYIPVESHSIFNSKKIKYICKIEHLINKWKNLWLGENPPVLYMDNDTLIDTRSGKDTYKLNDIESTILKILETPKTRQEICEALKGGDDKIENVLQVFEEKFHCLYYNCNTKKYLSLATYGPPVLKKPLIPESFNGFKKSN